MLTSSRPRTRPTRLATSASESRSRLAKRLLVEFENRDIVPILRQHYQMEAGQRYEAGLLAAGGELALQVHR